jgi:hypothetical protein
MVLVATTISHAFNIIYEPIFAFDIRNVPRFGKFAIVQEHEQLVHTDNKSNYISRIYLLGYNAV